MAQPKRRVRARQDALAHSRATHSQQPVVPSGEDGAIRLLALDISSTNIGFVLLEGRRVVKASVFAPQGELIDRLVQGGMYMTGIMKGFADSLWIPDALAYEGPAQRPVAHGKDAAGNPTTQPMGVYNLIAQARMVGVFLYTWHLGAPARPIVEVGPLQAKKALTGSGSPAIATKERMVLFAHEHDPSRTWSEHEADALGTGLSALGTLETALAVWRSDHDQR